MNTCKRDMKIADSIPAVKQNGPLQLDIRYKIGGELELARRSAHGMADPVSGPGAAKSAPIK